MSVNYINLGNTCGAFSETNVLPDQPYGNGTVFYILSGSTDISKFIKNSMTHSNPDSPDNTVSNVVTFSDFQFNLWWDANIVRSGTNRGDWRVITPAGASTDNIANGLTYDTDKLTMSANIISPVTSPWPATVGQFTGGEYIDIRYPGDTSSPSASLAFFSRSLNLTAATAPYVTNPTSNIFINRLIGPSGYSSYERTNFTSAGKFYLQKNGSTTVYLRHDTGFSEIDLSSQAYNPSSDSVHLEFKVFILRSSVRLVIALCKGTADGTTAPTNLGVTVSPGATGNDPWTVTWNNNTYNFTQTPPVSPAAQEGFIAITMLKFGSKYLYWDGTSGAIQNLNTGASQFTLKDYWTSGLSLSNVYQGMQFFMNDVFSTNAAKDQTGQIDIYKWNVLTNPPPTPQTNANANNTSNLVAHPNGRVYVVNSFPVNSNYTPITGEGWVLQASSTGTAGTPLPASTRYALVYANVYSGAYNPVAYANIYTFNSTEHVRFTNSNLTLGSWTSIPSHAYLWSCVRCSGVSQTSCQPAVFTATYPTISGISSTLMGNPPNQKTVYNINSSTTFTVTGGNSPLRVTIYVIGGGGGGGSGFNRNTGGGGGGGGGGQVVIQSIDFPYSSTSITYTVTIGNGGSGGAAGASGSSGNAGSNGQNTIISGSGINITAIGGFGGGVSSGTSIGNGGSGGNNGNGSGGASGSSALSPTSGPGGGGGGAGSAGTTFNGTTTGGAGGLGLTLNILGSTNTLGAGGGGGSANSGSGQAGGAGLTVSSSVFSGTGGGNASVNGGSVNTNYGGGGGGGAGGNTPGNGGNGGNGIIMIIL